MDEDKKKGLWVLGGVMVMMAFFGALIIIATKFTSAVKEEASAATPVFCNCDCPVQKCPAGGGIVADGYNVSISVNGEKYGPPLPGEEPSAVYCRTEDSSTLERMGPDMTLTKAWQWLEECRDELDNILAGYRDVDDPAGGVCRQGKEN